MKKILAFVAIVAMVFGAASCKKDDKGGKGKKEKKEHVAPINIEGDFSDWAKLDVAAHTLKGNALAAGDKPLAEVAITLRNAAKLQEAESSAQLISQIEKLSAEL